MTHAELDPRWFKVGLRIRGRRHQIRMKQRELARQIGMVQGQLSQVEQGKRDLRVCQLLDIAKTLECSPSQLLNDDQMTF